jgi:hypothetical protein
VPYQPTQCRISGQILTTETQIAYSQGLNFTSMLHRSFSEAAFGHQILECELKSLEDGRAIKHVPRICIWRAQLLLNGQFIHSDKAIFQTHVDVW